MSWLVETLRAQARQYPNRRALTFLADGESESATLSFAELDARAVTIARELRARGLRGHAVALLFPSGPEFVAAFLGCLYAGVIAVPLPPPRPNRRDARLEAVIENCQPPLALTTQSLAARLNAPANLEVWTPDFAAPAAFAPTPHEIAFLQYTSGSTARPRGAIVSGDNLKFHAQMLGEAFGQTAQTTYVSWLPLFHDMGLIGNVLQGLAAGNHVVLMPPEAFLMKPLRWLRAIEKYGAQISGAPNFAYQLCARKAVPVAPDTLDLSGWELAFCGAEPVRAATMREFARAFSPFGFRESALYPCYGLAEATLFVSGAGAGNGARIVAFNARELEQGRAVAASDDATGARELVSCGRAWREGELRIVEAQTRRECAAGAIGEIWVRGPHVARGYWNNATATRETFRASILQSDEAHWLATGDLGFIHDGELFVFGRLKDLIIIAGRNHACDDIEATVASSHPSIRASAVAAFGIETDDGEVLAVVAEIERAALHDLDTEAVTKALRREVAVQHDVRAHTVALIRPASLPRTSSGKVQRHLCRQRLLAQTLVPARLAL